MLNRISIIVILLLGFAAAYRLPASFCRVPRRRVDCIRRNSAENGFTAAVIVPTGVAATIGGYAGDALPSAKLLSSVVDTLITHPNVMNAAMLYWPLHNALYVEGSALDSFAEGRIALSPMNKGAHRIGLLLDRGIEPDLRVRHLHVANAMRASLGVDVAHCAVTSRNVNVQLEVSRESGASWGSIGDTETLVEGARWLVQEQGCTAVAVVVRFPEDNDIDDREGQNGPSPSQRAAGMFQDYRSGQGVDGIAGAEALISHVIGKTLNVPCAHAPAFSPMEPDASVSPKACAEELGYTFLPCVLAYLHRAPRLVPLPVQVPTASTSRVSTKDSTKKEGSANNCRTEDRPRAVVAPSGCLTRDDVDVVVAPHNALGGAAVLAFLSRGVPVIAVQDNHTSMRVSAADLQQQRSQAQHLQDPQSGVQHFSSQCSSGSGSSHPSGTCNSIDNKRTSTPMSMGRILHARSYAEAAGMIVALKNGILLEAITPYVPPISVTEL